MPGKTAFVYGTLMAPEVVNALIKRVPPMKPAKLMGYSRHRVKGVAFPAIIPDVETSSVQGQVIMELTDKEVVILDAYEAEEYYRHTVTPTLEDGTTLPADVYVWQDAFKSLIEFGPWDYEAFRSKVMNEYMVCTVEEFLKEFEAAEAPT